MTASLIGGGGVIEVDEKLLLDPEGRIKQLSQLGGSVLVSNEVPVLRYLRSGPQMEKMVSQYLSLSIYIYNII